MTTPPIGTATAEKFEAQAGTPATKDGPHLIVDNTIEMQERALADDIVNSKSPMIMITEAGAKSYAGLSRLMADAFPNVPVVFESKKAEQDFRTAPFIQADRIGPQIIGHFTDAAQADGSNRFTRQHAIPASDCIMVFGKPKQATMEGYLNGRPHYVSHAGLHPRAPRINISMIGNMMQGRRDQWATWMKQVKAHTPM